VRVWDLATGEHMFAPLVGHTSWVNVVTTTTLDNGRAVLSGGADRMLRVWDLTTGQPLGRPIGPRFSPLGRRLSRWWDRLLPARRYLRSWWDRLLPARRRLRIWWWLLRPVRPRFLTPLLRPPRRLWRRSVRLWRRAARTGQRLMLYADWVRAMTVVELYGRPTVVTGGDDRLVRLWDIATRKQIVKPLHGHHGPVLAVVVTDLGNQATLVSGDRDGTLCSWRLPRRRTQTRWRRFLPRKPRIQPHHIARGAGPITALAYEPRRGVLAARGNVIEFQPFDPNDHHGIELDAEITSLMLDGPDTVVATTLQGVAVIDLCRPEPRYQ